MAKECIALNWPRDAAFYAILAGDKELCELVGERLLQTGTPEEVARSVERILAVGNLRRHFCSGCAILSGMADAIPDRLISSVFQWVLHQTSWEPTHHTGRAVVSAAWKLLQLVAHRLSEAEAVQLVEVATLHDSWTWTPEQPNQVETLREEVVRALTYAVMIFPPATLVELTEKTLPLADERMQHHDLADVMNLLCNIASRSAEARELVAAMLYPSG